MWTTIGRTLDESTQKPPVGMNFLAEFISQRAKATDRSRCALEVFTEYFRNRFRQRADHAPDLGRG